MGARLWLAAHPYNASVCVECVWRGMSILRMSPAPILPCSCDMADVMRRRRMMRLESRRWKRRRRRTTAALRKPAVCGTGIACPVLVGKAGCATLA